MLGWEITIPEKVRTRMPRTIQRRLQLVKTALYSTAWMAQSTFRAIAATSLFFWLLSGDPAEAQSQVTHGDCSPTFINVRGNIYVNCNQPVTGPFNCIPDGGLPDDPVDKSILLNNRGAGFRRNNDSEKAVVCFRGALDHYAANVGSMLQLAEIYFLRDPRELPEALYYVDLALAHMFSDIASIDVEKIKHHERVFGARTGMPCHVRQKTTGENVDLRPLHFARDVFEDLGWTKDAIPLYTMAIERYPAESCVYPEKVGAALVARGNLHCKLNDLRAAEADYLKAIEVGYFEGKTALDSQKFFQFQGFYDGQIDGDFGPRSIEAMINWTRAGCPYRKS